MKKIVLVIMSALALNSVAQKELKKNKDEKAAYSWEKRLQNTHETLVGGTQSIAGGIRDISGGIAESKTFATLTCYTTLLLGGYAVCFYVINGRNPYLDPFRWMYRKFNEFFGVQQNPQQIIYNQPVIKR